MRNTHSDKLKVLDLFSGIGGFSLGLERTGGFETVAFCEIEPFPRRVLAKHWPGVPCYEDVRELTGARLAADGIEVDVITGGFPCQDISTAGKQAGMHSGTRSGLWSEIVRLVGDIRPSFVIVENVANLLSGPGIRPGGWFGRVLGDLAECGYDAEWECIPATAVGADHERNRVWVVAYPCPARLQGRGEARADGQDAARVGSWFGSAIDYALPFPREHGNIKPVLVRGAHGVPNRLDRVAALGNAVVPQIPELIGHAILASMRQSEAA